MQFLKSRLNPSVFRDLSRVAVRSRNYFTITILVLLCASGSVAAEESPAANVIRWQEVEPGYAIARYNISSPGALIPSPVVIARFDPHYFIFQAVSARKLNRDQSDVKAFVDHELGFAGINANFFDTAGAALGLVVDHGEVTNRLHSGGNALTGVIFQDLDGLRIVHRSEFRHNTEIEFALQAGPRLIADGKPLPIESAHATSRRSGCAITRSGDLLLYATVLRFPGATLMEIQKLLLTPGLEVKDALNFDGGGSSQLYLTRVEGGGDPLLISGGDTIPVALVVSKKVRPKNATPTR